MIAGIWDLGRPPLAQAAAVRPPWIPAPLVAVLVVDFSAALQGQLSRIFAGVLNGTLANFLWRVFRQDRQPWPLL